MPELKLVKDGYPDPEPGDYGSYVRSWARSLRARNLSPKTVKTYREAVEGLGAYLARTDGPRDLGAILREHVEGFIVHLLDTSTDSTANNRYRGMQQFFKWALAEGEIQADPMALMRAPMITEKEIPLVPDDTLKKLLKACAGREFTELRDTAIIRVLIDTGVRREEVASIPLDDLDLDTDSVTITRKGRRPATLDLSAKTCQAFERYLRARSHHPLARRPELWLGEKARGPLTADGIRQMLDRRCDQAGIPHIHPHQFRHTAADYAMKSGMSDNDIMRNFGWKSRQMLARYAAANADERAREAHRRLSPGDRVLGSHQGAERWRAVPLATNHAKT
jgi:integrase/recombinase XerC